MSPTMDDKFILAESSKYPDYGPASAKVIDEEEDELKEVGGADKSQPHSERNDNYELEKIKNLLCADRFNFISEISL